MQSIADQLVYEHEHPKNSRELDHLKFIWIERDPVLVRKADFIHNSCKTCKGCCGKKQAPRNLVEQLLSSFPPDQSTDVELEQQYQGSLLGGGNAPTADSENPKRLPEYTASGKKPLSDVVDVKIYLTGSRNNDQLSPFVHEGRPDIKGLFLEMRKEALDAGNDKVAVCVSAPSKVSELVLKACILFSDEKLRFDFHSETIEG